MTANTINIARRRTVIAASLFAAGALFAQSGSSAAVKHRSLVIVYSRTGNTLALARAVGEATGADLISLELVDPYASSYAQMTDIARRERQTGARREIRTTIGDLSEYDTIFIASPYWWGGLSVPMLTFLRDHPLEGKIIRPIITSGSSSPDGAYADIARLCPRAVLRPGFWVTGDEASGATRDAAVWALKE